MPNYYFEMPHRRHSLRGQRSFIDAGLLPRYVDVDAPAFSSAEGPLTGFIAIGDVDAAGAYQC
jgi:hypothetical protein